MKYSIYNPSSARRVIHSGVAGSKPIEILPRRTVDGVELAEHIAKDLHERFELDPENELRLTEIPEGEKPPAMKMKVDDSKIEVVKAKGKP